MEAKNIHLFVTSRLEADVKETLSPLSDHMLSLHDAQQHLDDLSAYITTQLSRKEYRWPFDVKESAHEALKERSNGMYVAYHDISKLRSQLPGSYG